MSHYWSFVLKITKRVSAYPEWKNLETSPPRDLVQTSPPPYGYHRRMTVGAPFWEW